MLAMSLLRARSTAFAQRMRMHVLLSIRLRFRAARLRMMDTVIGGFLSAIRRPSHDWRDLAWTVPCRSSERCGWERLELTRQTRPRASAPPIAVGQRGGVAA